MSRVLVAAVCVAMLACADADADRPTSFSTAGWKATPTQVGPLRIGMPATEALRVLGLPPRDTTDTATTCAYLDTRLSAQSVDIMVEGGVVVRVELRDSAVATAAGARVGDAESRIMSLYPNAQVQPHKYFPDGHILVVPADETHELLFETDGKKVLNYRLGVLPAVAYVEGCS